MNWLPPSILIPWIGKCLAELLLVTICLQRRVRCVWLVGVYTFTSTLGLMLLAEAQYCHYRNVDQWVSKIGAGVMLLVAVGLLRMLKRKHYEYHWLVLAYFTLLWSQVTLALVRVHWGCPPWLNYLGMLSWPAGVLWMAWEAWWIPRPVKMSWRSLAYFMRDDFLG